MKISEVSINDVKQFCRAEDSGEDENIIFSAILDGAKQFVMSQTGLTAEECDEKEDLTLAMLMLCADAYDNRTYTVFQTKTPHVNPAAKAIIDQYNMNIL